MMEMTKPKQQQKKKNKKRKGDRVAIKFRGIHVIFGFREKQKSLGVFIAVIDFVYTPKIFENMVLVQIYTGHNCHKCLNAIVIFSVASIGLSFLFFGLFGLFGRFGVCL